MNLQAVTSLSKYRRILHLMHHVLCCLCNYSNPIWFAHDHGLPQKQGLNKEKGPHFEKKAPIWIFVLGGGGAYACSLAGGHALDPLSLWEMINCITTNIISVTEYFFFPERSITRHKTRCIMLKKYL